MARCGVPPSRKKAAWMVGSDEGCSAELRDRKSAVALLEGISSDESLIRLTVQP
jgi:hypothetical protein